MAHPIESRIASTGSRKRCGLSAARDRSAPRRWLLASIGVLSVGLGILGILLPLLPTTPFLLLAAACFVRSSDGLYRWLITQRILGPYIRNYREHRAISWQAKAVTLVLLWAVIGYSAFGVVRLQALRIVLLLVAVAVTVHVLSLKTLTRERLSTDRPGDSSRKTTRDGT